MKNIDHNENILYKMNVDFLKYPGQTPDEVCLVDIETICLNQLFKILMSDAYRFCRHAAPPVSRTIIAC